MSTPKFTVANFARTWQFSFDNIDEAASYWYNADDSFYLDAEWPYVPELNDSFSSADQIEKYIEKVEAFYKSNQEIDEYWDSFPRELVTPVDSNPKTLAALSKPKLSDVPPVALFGLGAAMSDGAVKYGRFNWRDTEASASVFYDAMMRHLADWYNGEDFADDSKIHHLAHLMASCAIVLDAELHGKLKDDRDKRKPNSISRNPTWKLK